jgi:glutaredoxin
VRVLVADALVSERGNQWKPVRLLREALGTANDLVGRPFCTTEELAARRRDPAAAAPAATRREAAPVMLYFDGKDHRTKKKMEEVLRAREVPFQVLDVSDDEATRSWALAAAKQAEFPLLFIAGEPIGGLHELTQLDVNGALPARVWGHSLGRK